MFTLTHISDLHLGPLPKASFGQLLSKRITGYINWKRNRSAIDPSVVIKKLIAHHKKLNSDHTAITGDLINIGLPQEIENATNWLNNFSSPKDATLICGNHDAYVRGALEAAFTQWQPWIKGDDGVHVCAEANFPSLRQRDDVSLISCNSAIPTLPFMASGAFSEAQGVRLAEMLEQQRNTCRVIMIHHPPFPNATHRHKRLHGLSHFMEAVRQSGAELILHGHTHLDTINYIDGNVDKVPVICVPAAFQWVGHKKPAAAINCFEISKTDGNHWNINMQQHGLLQNGDFEVTLQKQFEV